MLTESLGVLLHLPQDEPETNLLEISLESLQVVPSFSLFFILIGTAFSSYNLFRTLKAFQY